MRAHLLPVLAMALLVAGCASTPLPDMPWREPVAEQFDSCTDFQSTRWHRLDKAPREADALRPMAQPHKGALPGKTRESWFQRPNGGLMLCEDVDPTALPSIRDGCYAWMSEFKREGKKWIRAGEGQECRTIQY